MSCIYTYLFIKSERCVVLFISRSSRHFSLFVAFSLSLSRVLKREFREKRDSRKRVKRVRRRRSRRVIQDFSSFFSHASEPLLLLVVVLLFVWKRTQRENRASFVYRSRPFFHSSSSVEKERDTRASRAK